MLASASEGHDRELVRRQGLIAAAARDGRGLEELVDALKWAVNLPEDGAIRERAKLEIWRTSEIHLPEEDTSAAIYECVTGEIPPTNEYLDAKTNEVDERNDTQAEIDRLAKLSPVDYDRERISAAERLEIRVKVLDCLVKQVRNIPSGQGRPIDLPEIQPWHEGVDGTALLNEIAASVKKYIVLSDAAADAISLWCVATHIFNSFNIFPRLALLSPTPQCGKTTLRDVIGCLVPKPLSSDNIGAAALFRMIEMGQPTLLLDEGDTYLGNKEDLRGILNSGHRRGGHVCRCVGDKHEPRKFSTWAPVVWAQIGKPPATIYSRSIVIPLRRKKAIEKTEPFRRKAPPELHALGRKAARWTKDNLSAVVKAELAVQPLPFLDDRGNDNWQPLLAIADAAGPGWSKRARCAAAQLASSHDGASNGEKLLTDIKWIFDGKPDEREATKLPLERIPSILLAEELAKIEGRPWGEWKRGKPITPAAIAKLLSEFKIYPHTIRLNAELTLKGYEKEDFEDAFERWLSSPGSNQTVTASQLDQNGHCDGLQVVTSMEHVTFSKASESNQNGHCDAVTAQKDPWEGLDIPRSLR
jgi:putative DNA primase/helicase